MLAVLLFLTSAQKHRLWVLVRTTFTTVDSNSFLSPKEILPKAQENIFKNILGKIFLFDNENVFFVHSFESPHRCDSNGYTQYTIIL